MSDRPENTESRQHDNRLFIDHVDLIGNGPDGKAGTTGEDGGLGDDRVSG